MRVGFGLDSYQLAQKVEAREQTIEVWVGFGLDSFQQDQRALEQKA